MKKTWKGILENLTSEQKEKAAQCKTSGELIALLGEWGNEIPDELVEAIAGGRMLDGILLADEDHHVDISPEVLSILRKSGSSC